MIQNMDYSKFRLRSFTVLRSHHNLHCGSHNELPYKYCEANQTDEDVMVYYYDICAIPWNRNPPKNTKCTVLRIDSKQTPPGFVRLKVERDNTENNPTYFRRPPCLKDIKTGGPSRQEEKMLTHEGRAVLPVNYPAVTRDLVTAIYCPYWPLEAEEWRNRKRCNGWPNEKLIARITRGGCHFVSKLRTWSSSDDTEWRFSFSKAELLLIHSWTPGQKLAYHAIRVVKRRISESCCGEGNNGLQTYYFKTLMLRACEEFPPEFWSEQNLSNCVKTVLFRFLGCLNEKFCQSYFIPECNIMSHLTKEESFDKELQTVEKFLRDKLTVVPFIEKIQIGFERPLEYGCLTSLLCSLPLIKELNGRKVHFLSECEWFLPEMKNVHAAIEAHLRLMSVDSVTERQTSKDYVVCLENFNCALIKRDESSVCLNLDISVHENLIMTLIRKLLRNSILIYRRKSLIDKPQYKILMESFPALLHGVTAAYRANFYFTAMKSYKDSLSECENCFEVLSKTIGFVCRSSSEHASHISLLICNSLSQIFDEHLQVILGFVTLHRNISVSNSPIIATSHEVCLKMSAWEFLKYIYIQCHQKLSSLYKLNERMKYPNSDFDLLYVSQLVDRDRLSAAILFAALRQSGAYKTPLPGILIPLHFINDPHS